LAPGGQFLNGILAGGRGVQLFQVQWLVLFLRTRPLFGAPAQYGKFHHLLIELFTQVEFACLGGSAYQVHGIFYLRLQVGATPKKPAKETDKASCQRD
jgi:hypothetical protein